jgi:hypothetical protein
VSGRGWPACCLCFCLRNVVWTSVAMMVQHTGGDTEQGTTRATGKWL